MQTSNTHRSFFDPETLKYLFFSSQGRINRTRFWQGYVVLLVLNVVISMLISTLGIIVSLALLYPTIVLSIKRAHDRDHSGHFLWLSLIPLVNLWVFVEIGFLKGIEGVNQFGQDPIGSLTQTPKVSTTRQPIYMTPEMREPNVVGDSAEVLVSDKPQAVDRTCPWCQSPVQPHWKRCPHCTKWLPDEPADRTGGQL